MGVLHAFPITSWRHDLGLMYFVETGTWRGDGLLHAAGACFQHMISIEANPTLAVQAGDRMTAEYPPTDGWRCSWEILLGDSAEALPQALARISSGPALFWLDAHLPERYQAEGTRLPLEAEVRAIVSHPRDHAGDVILMDDWRLYEAKAYQSGNFHTGPPGDPRPIKELLAPTHRLRVDLCQEGVLIAMPRGAV